ncbi:MAG: tRNA (guanosine(37)-N1)-methyltransferase TrmD [Candidatus Omnitrophica bacterium]|nr:tRNA (guanosine(37)-N1)-methyltransferase TrmD [Candidatus Omnitrophota bacterium]MDD5430524.1 tRNA (guanosine(37)-N1)-methyltransferase TrmD [Candidatus Omnitrophota bacterium]
MIIDVITIFPEMFSPVLGESIIKRAQDKGLVRINLHDLRDYSDDAHRKVDAASYGGGGMVFKVEPFFKALKNVLGKQPLPQAKAPKGAKVILFGPAGKTLTQPLVKEFLKQERLILFAPRYEGVDERVREHLIDEEISIGDFILSGAELAAMVFIDCLVRLVPGVVSNPNSVKEESFENSRLDFPHYTKPPEFNGWKVPEVLLSGNHTKVKQWRKKQALEVTRKKRPDLLRS